jgi:hypothetical protein
VQSCPRLCRWDGARATPVRRPAGWIGNTRPRRRLAPDVDTPAGLPRLVAWLRTEHPAATDTQIDAVFGGVATERLHRLERVLDDLARTCRAPAPADLAALTELDDLLDRAAG